MEKPREKKSSQKENPFAEAAASKHELPLEVRNLIHRLQRHHHFFSEMEDMEIAQFLRLCKKESYGKGRNIFEEGDEGRAFYLIIAGEIRIRVGEKEVARIGAGEVFGEMAILDNSPRSATAETIEDTVVFSVDRDILAKSAPTLGFKMATSLARALAVKLRETDVLFKKKE